MCHRLAPSSEPGVREFCTPRWQQQRLAIDPIEHAAEPCLSEWFASVWGDFCLKQSGESIGEGHPVEALALEAVEPVFEPVPHRSGSCIITRIDRNQDG